MKNKKLIALTVALTFGISSMSFAYGFSTFTSPKLKSDTASKIHAVKKAPVKPDKVVKPAVKAHKNACGM